MSDNSIARTNLERSLSLSSLDDLVRVKTAENVFLLVDCSGSMGEEMRNGKTRIDGLRDVVREIKAGRKVQLIAFGPELDGRCVFFCERPPAPSGGTPLDEALLFAKEQNAGRVVVISDGWPQSPGAALDAAKMFGGQVDVVFVGDPGDEGSVFLAELAASTGGTSFDGDLSEPKALGTKVAGLLAGSTDDETEAPDPIVTEAPAKTKVRR